MALLNDSGFQTRMGDVRSTPRLNSRVAVAVEWSEAGRFWFSNPDGGRSQHAPAQFSGGSGG